MQTEWIKFNPKKIKNWIVVYEHENNHRHAHYGETYPIVNWLTNYYYWYFTYWKEYNVVDGYITDNEWKVEKFSSIWDFFSVVE